MGELPDVKYLDNLKEPHTFSIRSLEDNSIIEWVYPGPAERHTFQHSPRSFSLRSKTKSHYT